MITVTLNKNNQTYQEYISEFFTTNYKALLIAAKKGVAGTDFSADDLLTELYLFLNDNERKIRGLKKQKDKPNTLMHYCAEYLYRNIRLYGANNGNSNFKGKFGDRKLNEVDNDCTSLHPHEPEPDLESEPDVWLSDNYSDKNIARLKNIDYVLSHDLTLTEKRIYELIYVENLNVVDIKKLIPAISVKSLRCMVKDLKAKLARRVLYHEKMKENDKL